jgi:hypothetical protein
MWLRLSFLVLLCWVFAAVGCDFDSSGVAESCGGEACTDKSSNASKREKDAQWVPSRAPNGTQTGEPEPADAATEGEGKPSQSMHAQGGRKAIKPADDDVDAGNPSEAPQSGSCATRKEVCNTIDDDCDDKVDEECECPGDKPVACYDGPSSTRSVGNCHSGSRTCKDGMLGECKGAVLPASETCNGMDDDCNGTIDDAPGLDSDLENCGRCGNACGKGESCCAGRCVNPATTTDIDNCGACGTKCTTGALPGCCGGNCVDLLTDATCGTCSNACGIFKLGGGFVCTCKLLEAGPGCAARSNSDEWMICR